MSSSEIRCKDTTKKWNMQILKHKKLSFWAKTCIYQKKVLPLHPQRFKYLPSLADVKEQGHIEKSVLRALFWLVEIW